MTRRYRSGGRGVGGLDGLGRAGFGSDLGMKVLLVGGDVRGDPARAADPAARAGGFSGCG
ncbi:hypothetical protein GCM10010505_03790 [Kitasatospora aburaviensis]